MTTMRDGIESSQGEIVSSTLNDEVIVNNINDVSSDRDSTSLPTMDADDEIVLDHSVPFRFTRRRDRIYIGVVCLMVLVLTLSIALPLTKENRRGNSGAGSNLNTGGTDWTMIGDEISNSKFQEDEVMGISLALSDDGRIIAVGNRHTSYVRLYMLEENQTENWVQMGSDIVGNDDTFGFDVALSGDGYTVAIGGPKQSAVYVFKFNESKDWDMVGGSIRGDMFRGELAGSAISLSLDGRVIAVGAHLNSDSYQRSGQVRAFQLSSDDSKWEQLGSDINGEAFGDQFGGALSLSNDGYTLAVGARFHDDDDSTTNKTNVGHVRVFKFYEDMWETAGSDIEGDEAEEGFGYSVSLSGDGRTCAIGNTNSELAVYRQSETSEWLSIGDSIPPIQMGNNVYAYVSLSRDGNVLAILEYRSFLGGTLPRVIVYGYDEKKSKWKQIGSALNGAGLALSADGSIVAVGGVNLEGLEYVRVLTARN
jgi:hypothetical protein